MVENLDLACARVGYELSQKGKPNQLEKLLRNAEAVLEERGPYALFLYLDGQKDIGRAVSQECVELLRRWRLVDDDKDWRRALQALAQDLDSLLFARDLLRRALIYGLEHVKARS